MLIFRRCAKDAYETIKPKAHENWFVKKNSSLKRKL